MSVEAEIIQCIGKNQPITISGIAQFLGKDVGQISRKISHLEQDGYVLKEKMSLAGERGTKVFVSIGKPFDQSKSQAVKRSKSQKRRSRSQSQAVKESNPNQDQLEKLEILSRIQKIQDLPEGYVRIQEILQGKGHNHQFQKRVCLDFLDVLLHLFTISEALN